MGNMKASYMRSIPGHRPSVEGENAKIGSYDMETEARLTKNRLDAARIKIGCTVCAGWLGPDLVCPKCGQRYELAPYGTMAMEEALKIELRRLERVKRDLLAKAE